jgi:pyruvate/2-oxoglutarate dehydrogenase complex dihydrolipoamide dehydrogenase (E3) component
MPIEIAVPTSGTPAIDVDKLRGWKDGVVKRLTGGLSGLAKQRKVTVVEGVGKFVSLNQLEVTGKRVRARCSPTMRAASTN